MLSNEIGQIIRLDNPSRMRGGGRNLPLPDRIFSGVKFLCALDIAAVIREMMRSRMGREMLAGKKLNTEDAYSYQLAIVI